MENVENKGNGLFRAAGWIAVVILFSKVAGFLRDVVVANYYGAGLVSDAYFYAYQIPALVLVILGGVGGPFHSATVAVFSKIVTDLKAKPEAQVKKLFNTFETLSICVFAILALICFFFPHKIMGIIISSDSSDLLNLASYHLKLMSPIVLIGAVIGIYYGILVTHKHFLLPNISPSLLSLGVVAILLIFKGDHTGVYLAIGTTLGAILQLGMQLPTIYKMGYSFKPTLAAIKSADLKEIMELLFPAFLSSTIGQIGLYIDMFFSSSLQEGAWTALGFANRIFQFPVGMLLTAILVPLFPLFSRLVGQKDYQGVAHYFNKGVGMLFFIGSYMMTLIFVVRTDAIRLALERGAFSPDATIMVSDILFFITLSILPYVFRDSATRLLYAFSDSKTPFYVALFSIILKIIFNILFVKPFGINGIALSTTLITLVNAVLLGLIAGKKLKLNYKALFKSFLKIFLASAIAGMSAYFIHTAFVKFVPWNMLTGFTMIGVVTLISFVIYIIASILLKVEYVDDFANRIKERLKR